MVIITHDPHFLLRVRKEKEGEGVAPMANRSQDRRLQGTGIGTTMVPKDNFLDSHPLQYDVLLLPPRGGGGLFPPRESGLASLLVLVKVVKLRVSHFLD